MKKTLTELCDQIGYTFKTNALLVTALTHRSYRKKNNERLEFLGDAVLNFCISQKLFHEYPTYDEGDLSRLRANLVNGEILAALAKQMGIDKYLRLGVGELKSGGLHRRSTLANAMEAIIGAIYVDGGIDVCRERLLSWFSESFIKSTSRGIKKDPKTQLQEYAQAKKMTLPKYAILSTKGREHTQVFHVECVVPELEQVAVGAGSSRRRAEQDAAEKLLILLGVST